MTDPTRTAAIVLAAGAGSRFGGGKLLVPLDGRPLLAHSLEAIRAAGLAATIVVLGHDADRIEAAIPWAAERRVRNPDPDAGLAGSLRLGFEALTHESSPLEAAFVVLGDQPFVDRAVFRALLAADVEAGRAFVVPRYVGGGGPNPVLVLREAWPLVQATSGDRGLGPMLAARPELVSVVELGGVNPDVDTPADLAEVAWADRVRRNREQVDRHREIPDGRDFYGPVTSLFRADPRRTDEPTLDALLALARRGETWLDIGAGAGRYALPLALHVGEVAAVEPSDGMRSALEELKAQYGIANVRVVDDRWPPEPGSPAHGLRADVALIAHLGYDIEQIGSFLDAMETAADRLCVAVLMERQPSAIVNPFWPAIQGEERVDLPGYPELVDLLRARDRRPTVEVVERPARGFESFDELHNFARRQLWLEEGGERDRRLVELLRGRAIEREARWWLDTDPLPVGIVTWQPGRPAPEFGRATAARRVHGDRQPRRAKSG